MTVWDAPRGRQRIVYYVASCQGCKFASRDIASAHQHCVTSGHSLNVTKHYRMEPPDA